MLAPDFAAYFDYWAIAILGTIALLLIDLFMNYLYRIVKRVLSRVIRDKNISSVTPEEIAAEDNGDSGGDPPFDELL